jgi:GSH-dependent disulfide-bond oxidoreductase
MVNSMSGNPSEQLRERHDSSDFDSKTQDIETNPFVARNRKP